MLRPYLILTLISIETKLVLSMATEMPGYRRPPPNSISEPKKNYMTSCNNGGGWCYRQISATDWEIYLNVGGVDVLGEPYYKY